tara:strand:+ start:941 stop:1225 length:285 start_codon:yes stop_codon:yes gene_type:complete
MANYYCYEWQRVHLEDSDFESSKQLKDLVYPENRLTETLKSYEISLACTKVVKDELVAEEYAIIRGDKLDNVFGTTTKTVPQKYIKEFNKLIKE